MSVLHLVVGTEKQERKDQIADKRALDDMLVEDRGEYLGGETR